MTSNPFLRQIFVPNRRFCEPVEAVSSSFSARPVKGAKTEDTKQITNAAPVPATISLPPSKYDTQMNMTGLIRNWDTANYQPPPATQWGASKYDTQQPNRQESSYKKAPTPAPATLSASTLKANGNRPASPSVGGSGEQDYDWRKNSYERNYTRDVSPTRRSDSPKRMEIVEEALRDIQRYKTKEAYISPTRGSSPVRRAAAAEVSVAGVARGRSPSPAARYSSYERTVTANLTPDEKRMLEAYRVYRTNE